MFSNLWLSQNVRHTSHRRQGKQTGHIMCTIEPLHTIEFSFTIVSFIFNWIFHLSWKCTIGSSKSASSTSSHYRSQSRGPEVGDKLFSTWNVGGSAGICNNVNAQNLQNIKNRRFKPRRRVLLLGRQKEAELLPIYDLKSQFQMPYYCATTITFCCLDREQRYTKDKKSVRPWFYILREMMWWSIFAGEGFPSKAAAQNVTGGLEKWKQGGGRWQTSLGGKITIGGRWTSWGRDIVGRRKAASRKIATRREKTSTKGK